MRSQRIRRWAWLRKCPLHCAVEHSTDDKNQVDPYTAANFQLEGKWTKKGWRRVDTECLRLSQEGVSSRHPGTVDPWATARVHFYTDFFAGNTNGITWPTVGGFAPAEPRMGRADYGTWVFLGFGTCGESWNRYLEDIKGRLYTPRILVGDITTLSHWRPLGNANGVRGG